MINTPVNDQYYRNTTQFRISQIKETVMKKLFVILAIAASITGCANTKDLAKTLRYADNTPVGAENIKFIELDQMKRGTTCTLNLLYFIPLLGDGSIIAAADEGKLNNVELIGETGRWYFPFSTNCTVVFGDKSAVTMNRKQPEPTLHSVASQ